MDGSNGNCFRCGNPGHWAQSETCPWLKKAASKAKHLDRIDYFARRYTESRITVWQKTEFIKHENRLWYDGKVPASLTPRSNS